MLLIAQTTPIASLSSNFTWIDWLVLIGYLVLVSIIGVGLAGKQTTMEDFFRGGNRLPWYAVSGSMIATIISAVTFIAVPAFAYNNDFTYLQFGIIAGLLSRSFVAFVLVPAYYKYQVYSPYDYMGVRLGEAARSVTTAMFSLLGLLAQAARVYLTAIILQLLLQDQLASLEKATGVDGLVWAVGCVGIIAVTWTMLGGITTVIWTDVMLFLVFVIGGLVAISVVAREVPGGLWQVLSDGWEAEKFRLWSLTGTDAATDYRSGWGELFAQPYTLWAALIAVTFANIGAYGTDQLLAQRIFTCRSRRDAQTAVLTSYLAELVVALMLLVGVGLWAFYGAFPERLSGAAAEAVADKSDNIFPVFILTQVPVALRGLIVAGVFAAAISSLTSILAALSQTTLSALVLPLMGLNADKPIPPDRNRQVLTISRVLIVVWGVALCAVAIGLDAYTDSQKAAGRDVLFLDLALGLANYVLGTLLAAFLLAWLPLGKDAYGLIWAAPLSVACVLASRFHEPWTESVCGGVACVLVGSWIIAAACQGSERRGVLLAKTIWLIAACALMLVIVWYLQFDQIDSTTGEVVDTVPIAWPWYAPLGGTVAFVFGYLLGEPRQTTTEEP